MDSIVNGLLALIPLADIAHIRRIRAVRHPLRRCSWRSLLQHAVHLLEGETFGLRDEHVGIDEAEEAKRAPEEEHFGTEIGVAAAVTDEVGRDNSDDLGKISTMSQDFRQAGPTQFHSQLEEVDKATPRARIGSGKISPISTQAPGPQVVAKKKM